MILAALLATPARAQPLPGAEKVGFADTFGWWLPVAGAGPRPAVIGLHGCDGGSARNELNARERAIADLLRDRGYHVLLPAPCSVNIHGAIDWLAARPDVDRARVVVLGWSHGGSTLLAALQHRIGPMPLQARAAIAFSPDCSPFGRTQGSYLPVAPLLILLDGLGQRTPAAPCLELANWTPKVMVRVLPESRHDAALFEFLERELR
jgi:dienelactone hydrolase